MKALCVGHCSYDIICPVEAYPIEDNKYKIEGRIDSGGGSAANAAYLLGKWGIETYMAGVVGADDLGTKIKKELESVQVKTDNIETIFDQPTSISFILVNKSNGSRTVFSPSSKSSGQARKYMYSMQPDVILIDGYEYTASREAINSYPEVTSIIDADAVTPEVLELCKYAKYIVCSKNFAETVSKTKIDFNNLKTLIIAYQNLKNRFPNNEIIVTLSEKGALYSINGEIKIMPGLNKQVKDTTGAGDIFHGAFAYGLLNNFPLEKCVSYANIAAGLSVDKLGVRASMPSLNEVISVYNEKSNPNTNVAQAPQPNAAPAQAAQAKDASQVPTTQPAQTAPQATEQPAQASEAVTTSAEVTPMAETTATSTNAASNTANTASDSASNTTQTQVTGVAPTEKVPNDQIFTTVLPVINEESANAATSAIPDKLPGAK